ncbi:hypothetical protein KSF78_0005028 [Schistosoma japonicum]|nr:hypothetical protein KSF78_0005028 [Schistosoma japonicum]
MKFFIDNSYPFSVDTDMHHIMSKVLFFLAIKLRFLKSSVIQILVVETDSEVELRNAVESFRQNLRHSINPKNLNKFITSYMHYLQGFKYLLTVTFKITTSVSSNQSTSLSYTTQRCRRKDFR